MTEPTQTHVPGPFRRVVTEIIGCFPWKFQGGEAAFARVVAFDGEWPKEI